MDTELDAEPARARGLQHLLGVLGAALIRAWLRLFGRTVDAADAPWLAGPIGPPGIEIGGRPYEIVAEREGLTVDRSGASAGLVPDFDVLGGPSFAVGETDAEVRRFYEQTSRFDLDVWSEAPLPGRLFLWLIVCSRSPLRRPRRAPALRRSLRRARRRAARTHRRSSP